MAELLPWSVYSDALKVLQERAIKAGYDPIEPKGISLGGCFKAIGTERKGAFRRVAHAHNYTKSEDWGWLCVLSAKPEKLITPSGQPSALFAHEYAHLIAHSRGHTNKWKLAISALGHPAEARYYKRA